MDTSRRSLMLGAAAFVAAAPMVRTEEIVAVNVLSWPPPKGLRKVLIELETEWDSFYRDVV